MTSTNILYSGPLSDSVIEKLCVALLLQLSVSSSSSFLLRTCKCFWLLRFSAVFHGVVSVSLGVTHHASPIACDYDLGLSLILITVFQTLTTSYACEVAPVALRAYLTTWVYNPLQL